MEAPEIHLDDGVASLIVASDIHGFAAPLAVVDRLLAEEGASATVAFCGDVCQGGIEPSETGSWIIRNAGPRTVLGNHDELLIRGDISSGGPHTEAGAFQRFDDAAREFWRTRPPRLVLRWRGRRILLTHGHRNFFSVQNVRITLEGKTEPSQQSEGLENSSRMVEKPSRRSCFHSDLRIC